MLLGCHTNGSGSELQFFRRALETVPLTRDQWLIRIDAGLVTVAASEVWKLVLRRRRHRCCSLA
jgi:hypothetical protein